MRWLVVAASLAFSALSINAAEPLVTDDQTIEAAGSVALIDPDVVVTPIPMPALVVELPSGTNSAPKLRPIKRVKVEKKTTLPPSMLSRTERHQMALAFKPKSGELALRDTADDEDDDAPSVADLTLHRFFHRPKVAKAFGDEDDDAADIPDSVKLRLFLARMKAVEAHAARAALQDDQAAGDELPDTVKLRLFMARAKAVAAHEKKFS